MAVKRTGKILDAGKREPLNGISKRYRQSLRKQTSKKAPSRSTKNYDISKEDISKIDEWNVKIEDKQEIA